MSGLLVVPQTVFQRYDTKSFSKTSLIENILLRIFLIFSTAFLAFIVFICLPFGVACFVSVVFGLISLALLILSLLELIQAYRKEDPLPLPMGFLKLIETHYPLSIFYLALKKRLTFEELHKIIECAQNKVSLEDHLSPSLLEKVRAFGMENLTKDISNYRFPLISLEELMLKHCPLYWLHQFVESGSKDVTLSLIGKEESRLDYWLGPLNKDTSSQTVFDTAVHAISNEISEKQLETLECHLYKQVDDEMNESIHDWDSSLVRNIVKDLVQACKKNESNVFGPYAQETPPKFTEERVDQLLHFIVEKRFSFAQLKMISKLSFTDWQWLCSIDTMGMSGSQVASFGSFLLPLVSNPYIQLALWEELRVAVKQNLLLDPVQNASQAICNLFSEVAEPLRKKLKREK
ncbi:DUF1389 domain-containing protein [Candidatus Chlamydia corallus]|uniref:DUF1389 domain-containing protein n=1 Tax=Candidatus Chlamydia corallus TaxID=2038470 RepID=UPI000C2FA854|nr:DUF1389 domain-containing protein [Candidatus Chlamydia corallus]